ncbi:3-oxoacyl-[acyl-carrier protein] reductase [Pusillimonas sp. T7-7]|uniref:SDR family NAD(P)-dependent oxidoreductase n=1 Tax=Pusillimonas sp. (strain T7-7) TaxID=1007105 RepID=UPI0002084F67|nr:SDR family NAD(P)-dependent oxidoreductase [Pusillimonas sp. T7-7]AEC21227.1 3-oxoacyl-[acyl-carrier protein] reductase [Pusillimonas sp. T7-7]
MKSEQKVAVITGGAQGIGNGIAYRLAREGYAIVIIDRDQQALSNAVSGSPDKCRFTGIQADVSDETSVSDAIAAVDQHFGRLDVLVNSAGILGLVDNKPPAVEATPLDTWQRVIGVNLTGPFLMCRAALPIMRRRNWGRIINVASRAARVRSGDPAYAASKGGLLTFSRYLAGEVAKYGITVNSIAPSRVQTPMTIGIGGDEVLAGKVAETPLGRIGTVEDMAGAVAFLVSDDSSFMTGAILDVNGGSFMQ